MMYGKCRTATKKNSYRFWSGLTFFLDHKTVLSFVICQRFLLSVYQFAEQSMFYHKKMPYSQQKVVVFLTGLLPQTYTLKWNQLYLIYILQFLPIVLQHINFNNIYSQTLQRTEHIRISSFRNFLYFPMKKEIFQREYKQKYFRYYVTRLFQKLYLLSNNVG